MYEARPFLGGRATSFPLNPSDVNSDHIDNCQHVLLRCFTNLLDFYRRCGVEHKIRFHDRLYFVRPGGAVDVLKAGLLPAPAHLLGSLLRFKGLDFADKLSILRAMAAMRREANRADLDTFTIADWLASKQATPRAVERFWRPILVSALNEEPDRSSSAPAFQVFLEGTMATRKSYQIGLPAVPLAELYSAALKDKLGERVCVHLRSSLDRIDPRDGTAEFYISAVPFERAGQFLPGLELQLKKFTHSPITGIHLWFDRAITELPHAVLLDRTLQWVFRKTDRYVQCVVSASRSLLDLSREEIVELACRELKEFFPACRDAELVRSHVIKEARATYSTIPGLQSVRPGPRTKYPNVFLAGDWTNTGWPATMEGAVRSGYIAAEAVARAAGGKDSFLLP